MLIWDVGTKGSRLDYIASFWNRQHITYVSVVPKS